MLTVLAGSQMGHTLLVADCEGFPLVFCPTCGKWGTRKIGDLLKPCTRVRTSAGTLALKKLAARRHPRPPHDLMVGQAGTLLADGTVEMAVLSRAQIRIAAIRARL